MSRHACTPAPGTGHFDGYGPAIELCEEDGALGAFG
jgi:hypothetical protein